MRFLFLITVPYFLLLITACNSSDDRHSQLQQAPFDTTFNAALWRKGNKYMRGRMVNDLIKSNVLKSLSKEKVFRLLGKPMQNTTYFCNYMVSVKDTTLLFNYLLLHIEIDSASNRVNDYWLTD